MVHIHPDEIKLICRDIIHKIPYLSGSTVVGRGRLLQVLNVSKIRKNHMTLMIII
jgi:chemotaxis protein histidine kinase CheA